MASGTGDPFLREGLILSRMAKWALFFWFDFNLVLRNLILGKSQTVITEMVCCHLIIQSSLHWKSAVGKTSG